MSDERKRVLVEAIKTVDGEAVDGGATCPVVSDEHYGHTDPTKSTRCMYVEPSHVHPYVALPALRDALGIGPNDDPVEAASIARGQAEGVHRLTRYLSESKTWGAEAGKRSTDEAVRILRDIEAACEAAGIEASPEGIAQLARNRDGHFVNSERILEQRDEARAEAQRQRERADQNYAALRAQEAELRRQRERAEKAEAAHLQSMSVAAETARDAGKGDAEIARLRGCMKELENEGHTLFAERSRLRADLAAAREREGALSKAMGSLVDSEAKLREEVSAAARLLTSTGQPVPDPTQMSLAHSRMVYRKCRKRRASKASEPEPDLVRDPWPSGSVEAAIEMVRDAGFRVTTDESEPESPDAAPEPDDDLEIAIVVDTTPEAAEPEPRFRVGDRVRGRRWRDQWEVLGYKDGLTRAAHVNDIVLLDPCDLRPAGGDDGR